MHALRLTPPETTQPAPCPAPLALTEPANRATEVQDIRHLSRLPLDPSRLSTLARLFAGHPRGLELFARMYRAGTSDDAFASREPDSVSLGEHAARVSAQSLFALGKSLGYKSNETITKYLTLFLACGFVEQHKVKHDRRVYLTIPAGPYIPPPNLLDTLDSLLARAAQRPKLKALVWQIRAQVIALDYVKGEGNKEGDSAIATQLRHILATLGKSELDQDLRISRAMSAITRLLTRTLRPGVAESPRGADAPGRAIIRSSPESPCPENGGLAPKPPQTESTSQGDQGFSPSEWDAPESPILVDSSVHGALKSPNQEDSGISLPHRARPESPAQVDSRLVRPVRPLPESTSQGDSRGIFLPQMDAESTNQGDSGELSEAVASMEVTIRGDSGDPTNVNVINIITNITFNVKLVSLFCCRALGEAPKQWPVYRKLFQSAQVACDPQAITAALMYTLVHRADGSMRNPPAVFFQRCRDFHQGTPPNPTVFAEARQLVERYGQLTYPQLMQQLATERAQVERVQTWQPTQSAPTPSNVSALQASQAPCKLAPIPSGLFDAQQVHIVLKPGGGMSWESTRRLAGQIAQDIRFGRCRVASVSLADGSYAVLVDKSEQKVHQRALYSEQEWREQSATLTSCYELFDRDARQRFSLLKKAVKQHE